MFAGENDSSWSVGGGRERVTERSGGIIDFVFLNGSERIGANYRGRKLIVPVKVSGIRGWMRCPHKCAADNQWNQSINWHGIATRAARLISFHGQRHYTGENRPASAWINYRLSVLPISPDQVSRKFLPNGFRSFSFFFFRNETLEEKIGRKRRRKVIDGRGGGKVNHGRT